MMMDLLQLQNDWLYSLSSFLGGGALGGVDFGGGQSEGE